MNIELKPVGRANYIECMELKTSEQQKRFVASNMFSLVQAAYEPDLYPLAVYCEHKMVGFILYDFDKDLNGWSMSRFMIDERFQRRGIGKAALERFIAFFIERYGRQRLYTSAEVDNLAAIDLYEKAGFKKGEEFEYETGGTRYREIRMAAQL